MTTRSDLASAGALLREAVPAGSRVLCAVSGGLDSMCLLHYLHTWGRDHGFAPLAAHFNHRLRDTADRDEAFVRDWCAAEGIPFFSGGGDVGTLAETEGLSVEEAARKLRYAFLQETAAREDCACILTAHHAGDNAETVLLNLIRGTGIRGLGGIPRQRGNLLRPFLDIPRPELAAYAAEHGVPHVEDETNSDPKAAARNLLRLRVMPLLHELNPRAAEHMAETARQMAELDRFLEEDARRRLAGAEIRKERVSIPVRDLLDAPPGAAARMLLLLLDDWGVGRKDVGTAHLEAVLDLVRDRSGNRLDLPHGVTARRGEQGRLILERRSPPPEAAELAPGVPVFWENCRLTLLDHCEGPGLALRPRREVEPAALTVAPVRAGDRLRLPGTRGGSRSVKRLCLDRHISISERDRLPAVYAGDRLAAVWRLGVDEAFLPEGEDLRFIQILEKTEETEHEK